MTEPKTLLLAAAMFVAIAPAASAYEIFGLDGNPLDMGRPMVNPIPRTTVTVGNEYPAGTILVNTAERRLYLMTGNGEAIRSAATAFAGAESTRSLRCGNGRTGPRRHKCWHAGATCRGI